MEKEPKKRGRPPKVPLEQNDKVLTEKAAPLVMKNNTKKQEAAPITTSDVMRSLTGLFGSVLNQTSGSTDTYSPLFDLNKYNPFLQNTRLKLINSQPASYAPDVIAEALKQPQFHEEMLQQASASLSASQYLYYRILREAADIPLYKYFVIPPLLTKEEYSKPEFRAEEIFVNEWLEAFDVANTLKRTSLEVKREGKPSYVFRQSLFEENKQKKVNYVTWQKLPPRYVKLTAIGEHGFIASFNLMLFLNPGFSPTQYPEYIQDIWADMQNKKIFITNKLGKIVPDLNKLRTYSFEYKGKTVKGTCELTADTYMYWVQLPQNLCFSFASDTSNAWAVPDTMGLFTALQELTDYSTLAGLITSTPLTAVLTGQAEFVNNSQPGQDQTELAPHTMAGFQNAFNAMVSGNVQAFLAPFKDLKLQSLPNVPNASDIKTKAVQNFISTAGEGGLITATDKPSVAMVKGAQLQAGSQYDFVTKQFQTILNNNLQTWAGLKYKWRVILWGDIFTFENTVKLLKELVAAGATFLLPKLASAFDLTMIDLQAIGEYVEVFKIYDKFKPLSYAAQQEKKLSTTGAGRPSLDDGDVTNDSTAASKDAGNNVSDIKEFTAQGICLLCGEPTEEGHILCANCEAEMGVENEDNGM